METERLQWKTKFNTDFEKEHDFLETILLSNGVKEEEINDFLHPTKKLIHDPFLMKNMKQAIELVRHHIKMGNRIFIKVDCD